MSTAAAAPAAAAAVSHPEQRPAASSSIYVFDPRRTHAYTASADDDGAVCQYPPYLSAGGGLQATRLAAADESRAYVASHPHIYEMQVTYPTDNEDGEHPHHPRPGGARQQPFAGVGVRRLPAPSAPTRGRKPALELQSLALHPAADPHGPSLLAGVDASQGILLHRLPTSSSSSPSDVMGADEASYLPFQPPSGEEEEDGLSGGAWGDFGWAGLAFDPQRPERLATVRTCGKTLAWTDIERASSLQVHRLWQPPAALAYISTAASHDPLLAVAEGPAFSLWDARTAHACIAREQPAPPSRLHALCGLQLPNGAQDHLLIVAADDGVLLAYDLRSLSSGSSSSSSNSNAPRARARWRCAVKHDIVGLLASQSSRVYAAGLDSELLPCALPAAVLSSGGSSGKGQQQRGRKRGLQEEGKGQAKQYQQQAQPSHAPLPPTSRLHESHHASMRADARWVGVALVPGKDGGDTVMGVSDRGTLYAVRHAEALGASWWLGGSGDEK